MNLRALITRVPILLFALLVTGCNATSTLVPPPNVSSLAHFAPDPSGALMRPGPMHPDRHQSWMAPQRQAGCSFKDLLPPCGLLYVSRYSDDDVVVIQRDKIVGTLTGFDGPDGVCADRDGNVWIVNNRSAGIVEYAHGGTKPVKTLRDPGVYPLSCAVNPITGAVVVTNFSTTGSGPGSVAIYHHATGKPEILSDPDIYYVYFCGFDAGGNLYIDGFGASGAFQFAYLPRGTFKFKSITLNNTINFPGNIQWDGAHVDVGDQEYNDSVGSIVYRTNGAGGRVVGAMLLKDAQDVVGYWVQSNNLIGPDADLGIVGLYQFPKSSKPKVHVGHLHEPFGAAISYVK